ncbi:uncharacterized protein LOC129315582 [Prosopis cineraria]|uniref:uncharacterized protein LOC129315582 n=1 Tax=Prosopis cineraria TaxID=364024 RepID=UPI00240F9146|nr:uncharacterized protein LOC129315582 [Prosopis cineraria]
MTSMIGGDEVNGDALSEEAEVVGARIRRDLEGQKRKKEAFNLGEERRGGLQRGGGSGIKVDTGNDGDSGEGKGEREGNDESSVKREKGREEEGDTTSACRWASPSKM